LQISLALASIFKRAERVMSFLSRAHFHNEEAAIARLEEVVWPKGATCPRCDERARIGKINGGRLGLWRCSPCKRQFTVTVGTVFERSHIPMHKWWQAAHLRASGKMGISAHQMHRTLEVSYKAARFMEHRLREAIRAGGRNRRAPIRPSPTRSPRIGNKQKWREQVPSSATDEEQSRAFIEKSREIGAGERRSRSDELMRRLANMSHVNRRTLLPKLGRYRPADSQQMALE
jgi:transposase-like protein